MKNNIDKWQVITWGDYEKVEDGEMEIGRYGKNLPKVSRIEYIICLKNGDHFIAEFLGSEDKPSGWFYVEDMPALYPVAWKVLQKFLQ